jgi:hypothetical protein
VFDELWVPCFFCYMNSSSSGCMIIIQQRITILWSSRLRNRIIYRSIRLWHIWRKNCFNIYLFWRRWWSDGISSCFLSLFSWLHFINRCHMCTCVQRIKSFGLIKISLTFKISWLTVAIWRSYKFFTRWSIHRLLQQDIVIGS